MRHSLAIEKLWSPSDTDEIDIQYSEACGLMAFAAVTGLTLSDSVKMFPQLEHRRWINRKEMRAALDRKGILYEHVPEGQWPHLGLCLIHFTGPWTHSGYPARLLQHTHWIGVVGEYIFDVNWSGWLPRQNWIEVVLEQLLNSRPNAIGWSVLSSYQFASGDIHH